MTPNDPPQQDQEQESAAFISPRLKAKLGGRIEEEEEKSSAGTWIAVALVGGIVILGGFLAFSMMRGGKPAGAGHTANAEEAAQEPVAETTPPPVADSSATASTPSTPDAAAPSSTPASTPAATPPSPTPTKTAAQTPMPAKPAPGATSATAGGAETAPAAPSKTYGIEVGTFLFEDRASSMKDALAASTSMAVSVVPRTEGDATTYAVVVGSFPSRGDAESKGNELLSAGTIKQSKVVTVK